MRKTNKISLIAILAISAGLYACSSGSSSGSSTAQTNQKIITYTKDGKLYEWDMFLAGKKKPVLRVHYIPGQIPPDAQVHTFDSLSKFEQALPQLDVRFSNPPTLVSKANRAVIAANNNFESVAGGLFLGVIPSVQAIFLGSGNNQCYISNPAIQSNTISASSSFVVTTANQQNQSTVSNSNNVSVGFAGFSASNSNTYSNNYQSSTASSSYNLAATLAAVIQTGVPSTNNLTNNGESLYLNSPNQFLQNCGSAAIEAYIGGLLTTLNMDVIATSQSAAQSFSDSVSTGYNSDSISNAYSNSSSNSSNYSAVDFTYDIYGDVQFLQAESGQSSYSGYIANALNNQTANYASCTGTSPDMTACSDYNSAMASAVMSGIGYAQASVAAQNSTAYSTLYPFADGINIRTSAPSGSGYINPSVSGSTTNANIQVVTANSSAFTESNLTDPYVNYAASLTNAISSAYQLNTLAGRANFLASLPGLATTNESIVLSNIAKDYLNDSNQVISVASSCYNAIMESYPELNPPQCNANISLANASIIFPLSQLPNNVYQIYGSSTPESGSLQELLLNNSVALQYQLNYNEIGTGYWGNDMIRGGNIIQLGMAYFNQSEYSSEFFGGTEVTISANSGYFYPTTSTPVLGSPNSGNTYINGTTSYSCTQWWQPLDAGSQVCSLVNYPTSTLYFATYTLQSSQVIISFGQNVPSTMPSISLNKIIAVDAYTQDSSVSQNNVSNKWDINTSGVIPSITQLAQGASLPSFSYASTGFNTTQGGINAPSQCYAGVYLPNVDTNSSTIANGYGNPNSYNYLCGTIAGESGTVWLALSANPNDAFTVTNIQQSLNFSYSSINNFFGFNWW